MRTLLIFTVIVLIGLPLSAEAKGLPSPSKATCAKAVEKLKHSDPNKNGALGLCLNLYPDLATRLAPPKPAKDST